MPDLSDLCRAAVDAASVGEQVEAFAQEARRTEVRVRVGQVEGLEFSESRGVGVRVIRDSRQGYVWMADPDEAEVVAAVSRARDNAASGTADPHSGLPTDVPVAEALDGLFRESLAGAATAGKVGLATELERAAIAVDPRVSKVAESRYGDAISRVAIASTEGVSGEYARTDCWVVVETLAEEGDETQIGSAFRIARAPEELDLQACGAEAAQRAARLLGATKPESGRFPVVLDPQTASSFLEVLAPALTADAVQKGRSLFAGREGSAVGSAVVDLFDDGRLLDGPGAAPFDDEGVPTGRNALIEGGILRGLLFDTYTGRRGGVASTGNASRGSYKGTPHPAPTNLYLAAGDMDVARMLASAEGGVLIQEVSGIHSGTNPISGEFSVGATGLRIRGGELAEPLREMTVASTIPDMLNGIVACGDDLRFFSSVGAPSVLVGEMTVAGL